jgi:hypothetical protein
MKYVVWFCCCYILLQTKLEVEVVPGPNVCENISGASRFGELMALLFLHDDP